MSAPRPPIRREWAPDPRMYVWMSEPAWEGIAATTEAEARAAGFAELEWDGGIRESTAAAVLVRSDRVPAAARLWLPLSALRMYQAAPGERPRFALAGYLAGAPALRGLLAGPPG